MVDSVPNVVEALYRERAGELRSFFRRHTYDSEAAADLVSETFAVAFGEAERFPGGMSRQDALAQLYVIARRALSDFYGRGRVELDEQRYGLVPPEPPEPESPFTASRLEFAQLEHRLIDGIERLPEAQKIVLALHAYESLDFDQVGRALGVSTAEARHRYAESMRALSGLVELEHEGGQPQPTLFGPDGSALAEGSDQHRQFSVLVQEVSEGLIAALAKEPELVYRLTPRRFEELVAELYGRRGFEVVLTPPTGDQGVDVYVTRHDELGTSLTVVQCKRYAADNKIGAALVRELQGTVHATGASAGVLLTTAYFTKGARAIERDFRYQLSLQDYYALRQLIRLPRA